ncbi:hypothetical protein RE9431_31250 [Prescottella equi]|nr:hypothetical protein RE9431_31250 [Prescottella equi]
MFYLAFCALVARCGVPHARQVRKTREWGRGGWEAAVARHERGLGPTQSPGGGAETRKAPADAGAFLRGD